jgi:hypothetical protein
MVQTLTSEWPVYVPYPAVDTDDHPCARPYIERSHDVVDDFIARVDAFSAQHCYPVHNYAEEL